MLAPLCVLIDWGWAIAAVISLFVLSHDSRWELVFLGALMVVGGLVVRFMFARIADSLHHMMDEAVLVEPKAKKQKKAKAQQPVDEIPDDSRPAVVVQYDLWGNAVKPSYPDTDTRPQWVLDAEREGRMFRKEIDPQLGEMWVPVS